jgi:hypothetical protein
MLDLADPSADLIHFWDDDDLYLPWHLEDCLKHIGDNVAWKPESCWLSYANVTFSRHQNRFEGSWIFRADYLRSAPLNTHPAYTDHPVYLQTEEAGLVATTDFGGATSYIYRWANGSEHISGFAGPCDESRQCHNIELWRSRSNDVPPDGRLLPADLTLRWRAYLEGIKPSVSLEQWELNRQRLLIPS